MGIFNLYETVRRAIQDVVAPEIQGLKGDFRALQAEIKRLDEKIDSKHNEVLSEIRRLDEKMTSEIRRLDEKMTLEFKRLDDKVTSEIRRLDDKIHALDGKVDFAIKFHERLAKVEAKLGLGQGS